MDKIHTIREMSGDSVQLKFKTIQNKLFVTYSILIVSIVVVFSLFFYYYSANTLTKRASESMHQSTVYISNKLDSIVSNLDDAAVKVIYVNTLKNLFFQNQNLSGNTSDLFTTQRQINEILFTIMGPLQRNWQINIFDKSGRFIGTGDYSQFRFFPKTKMSELAWVSETYKRGGKKYISPPRTDDWGPVKNTVISVSRMFESDIGTKQQAIVEVQQNYTSIEQIIADLSLEQSDVNSIYVYNETGEVIYPNHDQVNDPFHMIWNELKELPESTGYSKIKDKNNNENNIIAYSYSTYTGWTVIALQSEAHLLEPVTSFRNITLIGSIGILLITLIVSFYVAKGVTSPIKKMLKSIRSLSLDTLSPDTEWVSKGRLNELEVLDYSYRQMRERLQGSIEETLLSRSQEMQARLIALQSQMNPHFLYNTLATISIIAEERGQEDITQICDHLSNMLRYILSNATEQVTIADEVNYAANYFSLMKIRFDNSLTYSIKIDPNIMSYRVPKLIIQPLIENSLKYGIHVPPPWNIELTGSHDEHRWRIRIQDNGDGFPVEVVQSLNEFDPLTYTQQSIGDFATKRKGLGLNNILTRLYLLYGPKAEFKAFNPPEGGACVIIGGPLNISDNQ